MRRRKDTFVRPNSVADVQELMLIAQDHKEVLDYKEKYYKKRSDEIARAIMVVREDFLNFLKINNIDPNYPVMSEVTGDQGVPDTLPEQSVKAIPIEQAMLPNIPNDVFLKTINLLKDKYGALQEEIEEYNDTLSRMRLQRARIESKLEGVIKATEEYRDKVKDKQNDYDQTINNVEKIKYLYQNLLDFKYLFSSLPSVMASESYIRFKNDYLNRYCSYYCSKKKLIKNMSDKLQDTYTTTVFDQMGGGFYTVVFRDISLYFGPFDKDNLPDQYISAIGKKDDILKKLNDFSVSLDSLISNNVKTMDAIRGVKGVGNSMVEGLVASTNEIAQSFAAAKKIEHTTFQEVSSGNSTVGRSVDNKIYEIKSKMQGGVENLDEKFIKAQKNFLRRLSLTFGFLKKFVGDGDTNFEDHLREKVRQKFGGNIPFCDEEETTDSKGNKVFIKKADFDEKTGKSKTDTMSNELYNKTRDNKSVLAH